MAKFEVSVLVYENGKKSPQYDLNTDLSGEITLRSLFDTVKLVLIETAREVIKEEQAAGFDKKPVVVVDGKVGKPIQDVNPIGSIEFRSRVNMDDILLETYEALLQRSPILEGIYSDSHYVLLNRVQVASTLSELKAWLASKPDFKEKDLIRFINITPYARKLERLGVTAGNLRHSSRSVRITKARGQKGRDGIKYQAPNGVYYLTSRSIIRKYKGNANIKFDFISGSTIGLDEKFKRKDPKARKSRPARTYLYPMIVISVSESGIK